MPAGPPPATSTLRAAGCAAAGGCARTSMWGSPRACRLVDLEQAVQWLQAMHGRISPVRSARTLWKCVSVWNPRLIVTKSRPYSVSARSACAGSFKSLGRGYADGIADRTLDLGGVGQETAPRAVRTLDDLGCVSYMPPDTSMKSTLDAANMPANSHASPISRPPSTYSSALIR